MSTTSRRSELIGQLDLAEHSWVRVDIGDLGGAAPRTALTGATNMPFPVAQADPTGDVGDLIGTYWAALFLASRAFIRVLSSSSLTGWQTVKITVDGNPAVHGVALLQVVGRCGPVNETGLGRTLDLRSWDGSDLFVPANESSIFLSARAVDILRGAGLRNVEIETDGVELIGLP
jgi:hypothetical protein